MIYQLIMLKTFACGSFLRRLATGLSIFLLGLSGQATELGNAEAEAFCMACLNASAPSAKGSTLQRDSQDIMEGVFDCKRPFQTGQASLYGEGDGLNGKPTASGEPLDSTAMTAAHKKLPLGTWILVENLETKEKVYVQINDRGPYHKKRILDLSAGAAEKIGLDTDKGVAKVKISVCKKKIEN